MKISPRSSIWGLLLNTCNISFTFGSLLTNNTVCPINRGCMLLYRLPGRKDLVTLWGKKSKEHENICEKYWTVQSSTITQQTVCSSQKAVITSFGKNLIVMLCFLSLCFSSNMSSALVALFWSTAIILHSLKTVSRSLFNSLTRPLSYRKNETQNESNKHIFYVQ